MPATVVLSLGSNLGDRKEWLRLAIQRLSQRYTVKQISSLYETAAWGKTDQADFLNLVVELETDDSPRALLQTIQTIEQELERKRLERWGPRTIDIDILFYNDEEINEPDLVVPHPRLWERAFVLIPLLEIAPNFSFQGRRAVDALAALQNQTVRLYEATQTDRQ